MHDHSAVDDSTIGLVDVEHADANFLRNGLHFLHGFADTHPGRLIAALDRKSVV